MRPTEVSKIRTSSLGGTLDTTSPFDNVQRSALTAVNQAFGLPPELMKYLEELYENSYITLSSNRYQLKPLRLTTGVKRVNPLSESQRQYMPQKCGYILNNYIIRAVAVADDSVLPARSHVGL